MKNFLTKNQEGNLKRRHRKCKKRRQADRIKAVLLRNDGYSFEEIAKILLLDDSTVRSYVENFEKKGVDDLLQENWTGGKGYLSAIQEKELKKHISDNLYMTTKKIRRYVKEKYGVTYKERGMNNLLHRLGFVYKKPKRIPGKADQEKQEAFVEMYEKIKKEKGKKDRLWFLDGVHPRHNALPSYGWILRGEEKTIKANTGRKGLNINGALNIEDYKIITREDETLDASSTINLIKQIEKIQPTGKIYLIADNAPYNYARLVKEHVNQKKRIELLYLPPYSPNLNVIERLWKLYKKVVMYNKYYEKLEEFVEATRDFFENATVRHRKEMESLLTDNFHIVAA